MLNKKEEEENKHFETSHHLTENQNLLPEEQVEHENLHWLNDDPILKSLLVQYNESAKRGRGVLIIVSLAALLLLVGVFNHRMSWLATQEYRTLDLQWPEKLKGPISFENYVDSSEALLDAVNRISENTQPKFQQYLIHEVYDGAMKTVDVPILGVQIYIDDLPIIGSIGLLILLIWFYYVRRRERGLVKILRSKAVFANPKNKKQTVELIYSSIALNQVFNIVPNVDSFEKRTHLRLPDKFLKSYVSFLTLLPVLIIFSVVVIDVYETYWMHTVLKVPRDETIIAKLNKKTDSLSKHIISKYKEIQKGGSNSLYQKKPIVDALYKQDLDSVKKWHYEILEKIRPQPSTWQKRVFLEEHMASYKDRLIAFENKYFEDATLIDFVRYRKEEFDKMMEHKHRGFKSLDQEIWYLRTLLPIFLVLVNLFISWMIYQIAKSSEGHLDKILREYTLYFKLDQFNFDSQPIAHLKFIVLNKEKPTEAITDAKIVASKNYRQEMTNTEGQAIFEYLQVLGHETFTISHEDYKKETRKAVINRIEGGKPKKTYTYRFMRWFPLTKGRIRKMREEAIKNTTEEIKIYLTKKIRKKIRK